MFSIVQIFIKDNVLVYNKGQKTPYWETDYNWRHKPPQFFNKSIIFCFHNVIPFPERVFNTHFPQIMCKNRSGLKKLPNEYNYRQLNLWENLNIKIVDKYRQVRWQIRAIRSGGTNMVSHIKDSVHMAAQEKKIVFLIGSRKNWYWNGESNPPNFRDCSYL